MARKMDQYTKKQLAQMRENTIASQKLIKEQQAANDYQLKALDKAKKKEEERTKELEKQQKVLDGLTSTQTGLNSIVSAGNKIFKDKEKAARKVLALGKDHSKEVANQLLMEGESRSRANKNTY